MRLNVRLVRDRAHVAIDFSGGSLHRRGYRLDPGAVFRDQRHECRVGPGRVGQLVDIRLQLGEVIVWIEVLDADGKLGLHRVDRAAGPFPDAGFAMVDAGVGVGRIVHCEVRF